MRKMNSNAPEQVVPVSGSNALMKERGKIPHQSVSPNEDPKFVNKQKEIQSELEERTKGLKEVKDPTVDRDSRDAAAATSRRELRIREKQQGGQPQQQQQQQQQQHADQSSMTSKISSFGSGIMDTIKGYTNRSLQYLVAVDGSPASQVLSFPPLINVYNNRRLLSMH